VSFRRFAGALFSALLLSTSTARADGPLTLEEALRLAASNNERALKAPLRVDAAEGALDRARTAFLPTLGAVGTGSVARPKDMPGARSLAGNGTLNLSQPLLNLSSFPLYAQARRQLESERWGAIQDKRLLAFDTAQAFLVVLTSERLLAVARDKLERARASQKDAEARAKAQLTGSNDVTLSLVDVASAAGAVAVADGNMAQAYVRLGFLVGRPVAAPLTPPDRTMRAAESGAFRADDVTRLAEDRRPDVRSAIEHTASLREFAKEPLYRLAPTIAVSGQIKLNIDPLPPDRAHEESATLTLSWNIYDAGVRYADRRTRLAQAESGFLDEKALRRSIATDVALALAALKSAREVFQASAQGVDVSRKNTSEVETLYKQGLAKALDVVDANGRRADAEAGLETARLAMQQAYLALRLAVGFDPLEDAATAAPPPSGAPPPTPAVPPDAPPAAGPAQGGKP
jgi:outer membrane protein TolC